MKESRTSSKQDYKHFSYKFQISQGLRRPDFLAPANIHHPRQKRMPNPNDHAGKPRVWVQGEGRATTAPDWSRVKEPTHLQKGKNTLDESLVNEVK